MILAHLAQIRGTELHLAATERRTYLAGLLTRGEIEPYDAARLLERVHASGWLRQAPERVTDADVDHLLRLPAADLPWALVPAYRYPSTWAVPVGSGPHGRARCLVPTHDPHHESRRPSPLFAQETP